MPQASTVWKNGASLSRETMDDSIAVKPAFFSMRWSSISENPSQT